MIGRLFILFGTFIWSNNNSTNEWTHFSHARKNSPSSLYVNFIVSQSQITMNEVKNLIKDYIYTNTITT